MNPSVDEWIKSETRWGEAFGALRQILLDSGLTEDIKWMVPCYSFEGSNVALIHGFKDYCAILFIKGALLKDPQGILVQQTKNVQAGRQIRFTEAGQVADLGPVIRAYLEEAVEAERSGMKVTLKKTTEFSVPEEFQVRLSGDPGLRAAFEALTPGRQRGYLLHFSSAKQAKTREARIEKCIPAILDGLGLDD